jgi:peptidoglycan/xylan/chitin deacetylase (PgdA/CDA1 family)
MRFRAQVRCALYGSGAFGAWHRIRNARTLTVALFHRVLPARHPDWRSANPDFTISDTLLRQCLVFFRKHYNTVSLSDVLDSRNGDRPLPPRALLVTFDDGWADTADVAMPVLRELGLRPALFAVTDAVQSDDLSWWQDVADFSVRAGHADRLRECLDTVDGGAADPVSADHETNAYLALMLRLGRLGSEQRAAILAAVAPACRQNPARRQMLNMSRLRALARSGCDVGSHGAAHLPLTSLPDDQLTRELRGSRDALEQLFGDEGRRSLRCLSFPHGRYDARVIREARRVGYDICFSSDAVVNTLDPKGTCAGVLGRINIAAGAISDAGGELQPDRLASLIFTRPQRLLSSQHDAPGQPPR